MTDASTDKHFDISKQSIEPPQLGRGLALLERNYFPASSLLLLLPSLIAFSDNLVTVAVFPSVIHVVLCTIIVDSYGEAWVAEDGKAA